jgi:hypothetical protein
MAERTPVVKKYRDALENVIGATMDFLAHTLTQPINLNQDPALTSPSHTRASTARTPQSTHRDLSMPVADFSPGFTSAAQESYVRGSAKSEVGGDTINPSFMEGDHDVFGYMPQPQTSPGGEGRWEGRHGELGQMDAEWMLSLCEGDGFSLQMLNEMMRFEPSFGA